MSLSLIEGWTYPIEYELLAAGTAADLSGCSVEMVLRDRRWRGSTTTGEVDIYDTTGGKVRFLPGTTGDLVRSKSPYSVRFKITDGTGNISYFPNSVKPEYWTVSQ